MQFICLMMSKRMRDSLPYLQCKPKVRKVLICECCHNVLKGTVPLTKRLKQHLSQYKKHLRDLANKKVSRVRKQRLLTQQNSFLQLFYHQQVFVPFCLFFCTFLKQCQVVFEHKRHIPLLSLHILHHISFPLPPHDQNNYSHHCQASISSAEHNDLLHTFLREHFSSPCILGYLDFNEYELDMNDKRETSLYNPEFHLCPQKLQTLLQLPPLLPCTINCY